MTTTVRTCHEKLVSIGLALAVLSATGLLCSAFAQPVGTAAPRKQKRAAELIRKQEPPKVSPRVLERATPETSSIFISLGKQRAFFQVGEEVAIDTPISSGKRAGMTPSGTFKIVQKDADHRSNLYGDFVNPRTGRIVRSGVSARIDSAPSGTVFRGAPMRWFMRFGDANGARPEGMHTGILPGYPASHGCVRLPDEIAKLFFDRVVNGTPVIIAD